MSHKSQLIKNTMIIAIGKISTQIISYILLPLFTSKMAVNEYGIYDFICTVSIFLCPIITLLMEESMFRFLIDARDEKEKKQVISQTIIYTVLGIIAFIPIAIIVLKYFSDYSYSLIIVFIIFVISNIAIGLSNALARGLSKIKLYSLSNFILGLTTILLTFIMLLWKPNAESLLWANTIANLGTAFFIFIKLKLGKYIGKTNKTLMKKMVRYSIPLVPNSISWSIINMSDRLFLTSLVNAEANGIYAMASRFPNIINVVYSYFYTAWKETAAKIVKEKNKTDYYSSIYLDMKKIMFAVTICLIAVMPFAFPIFIKDNYAEAYVYIPIIMIATYYSCISSFYGGIFGAFKKTRIMGTTTIIAATINLVVDLALIKYIGIYAACLSTLLADIIVYYYRKIKLKKYVRLNEINPFGPALVLTLICLAYYTKYMPFISDLWYWLLNILALLIAVLYSFFMNKTFLNDLLNKLKGRKSKVN